MNMLVSENLINRFDSLFYLVIMDAKELHRTSKILRICLRVGDDR